jgi:PAS domain S-box-containing protein
LTISGRAPHVRKHAFALALGDCRYLIGDFKETAHAAGLGDLKRKTGVMPAQRFDAPRSVALAAGIFVAAFAAAVLAAWVVHYVPLIQSSPSAFPLTRQGAQQELLLGAALICLAAGAKRATLVLATIVLIVALLVGFEYVLGRNLGIDQLLGKDYISRSSSPPGRISPAATLAYFSAAVALLVLASQRPARYAAAIAGIIASMIIAVGGVMVLSHALGQELVYTWDDFRPISVQASLVVVFLSVGIMILALEESRTHKTMPRWLPTALTLGLSVGALGIWQALMVHKESQVALLFHIILAGGIASALLIGIAVSQAQKAWFRSRELEQGKAAFERLFDASADALLVVDHHGRIVRANQRIQELFGYTPREVVGERIESLVPIDHWTLHSVHRDDYFEHAETRVMAAGLDLHGRRKDASQFPADVSLTRLQSAGELLVLVSVRDITERKQAEEALRQSEERFRSVFENSPVGLLLITPDYRIMKANESFRRMLGYSETELEFLNPLDFTYPEDLDENRRRGEALFAGELSGYTLEKRFLKKNREIIWTNLRVAAIRDREGRVVYGLGIIEDITERRHAQQALLESEERFRKVFETSPLGMGLITPDYRLAKVNRSLCRMSGYSEAELLTMNPLDHTHPDDWEESAAMSQRLLRGEIPFYQIEKRYIRKNGEIFWATLTSSVIRDHEGRLTYVLGMVEDITQRKEVEGELRLAGEVLGNMQEGVCLVRIEDGIIVHANHKFETMYGYEPNEMVGLQVSAINGGDRPSAEIENEIRTGLLQSGTWRGEILQRRKGGQTFWCAITASTVRHHKFGLAAISIHQDITERKCQQEALRESEELFRGLVEQSPVGVSLMGMDYRLVKVNPAYSRMLGYSEDELTKMTVLDLTLPEDRSATVNLAEGLFVSGGPLQKIEKRYITKSGQIIWARINASVIHDSQGKPIYGMGIIEDITDRKRSEEELRVLSQRLSLAVKSAALGIWEWDLRTDLGVWNERMFEIFRIQSKSHVRREDWEPRIYREDLPRVDVFMEDIVRNRAPQTTEFRVALPDGALRYVSALGGPIWDEKGNPSGVVGVALDVTERKQAEHKLAKQAALLDLAHDAILACDLEGRITFWSRGAMDTYGWSAAEAVGISSSKLLRTEFPVSGEEVRAVVLAQGGWEGELVHTTRDGRQLVMASRWSLERDEAGAPKAILQINRDITVRKQLEDQIESSREQAAAAARLSALGMMAGGVAHEINNPLAIIHALASDLIEQIDDRGAVPPEAVARSSRKIVETSERIAHIVKSLRKISREGTKDRYYPVRIGKILEETLEMTRARFEARGVKLIVPGSIPDLTVSCREVQIEQVVLNLLQNAFEAVIDQRGERWVRVDVAAKDGDAVVSVIDSGPGVPYDLRDYIGQPFFTTKEVGKGAGLGLSLSKTIAEEHGGRVEYDEESGHTRFSLILPLARQAEAA